MLVVNSEDLIASEEYLSLCTKYHINQCRYKRVQRYLETFGTNECRNGCLPCC